MKKEAESQGIAWREWSEASFEEARTSNRLVLLDLSAEWCHWCHVMDRTTYSDKAVVAAMNQDFIPVRVDIDERPDISERYNRGGFPTTVFLSDRGESVWGATYIPPADMKRIMTSILAAKASGEIDRALDRSRTHCLDIHAAVGPKAPVDSHFVDSLLEDMLSTYDVEHGGFGLYPKFPHPAVIDLLLIRYADSRSGEIKDAVIHTLDRMTEGLFDRVEGGVFRYSVTRDWREPHYEKMLETNLGFLRNLARASVILESAACADTARGVAKYLLATLRDAQTGGFFGSQDADEAYYKLPAGERVAAKAPTVVKAIYGGWNSEAVSVLAEAGALLGESEWVKAARVAFDYDMTRLWNPDMGLLRHAEGMELYLFEDQASFLEAILAVYGLIGDDLLLALGGNLVKGVDANFKHPDGGYADIRSDDNAIGELVERRRSLVSNSKWACALALLLAASHDPEPSRRPREIVDSFSSKEIETHGLFASDLVLAWDALADGPSVVEVRSDDDVDPLRNELWMAARKLIAPSALVVMRLAGAGGGAGHGSTAVICTSSGCSDRIRDPDELVNKMKGIQTSQI